MLNDTTIPIGDLDIENFLEHPIWAVQDAEWDEVRAVDCIDDKPLNETKYDALFILCELILNDGTHMLGTLAIHTRSQFVYVLELVTKDHEVFRLGRNELSEIGTMEKLSQWLDKSVDQISPLKFITPYRYSDASPICGEIDLRAW